MENLNLTDRRGNFSLNTHECLSNPELWGRIMGKVLITRCEHIWLERRLEYQAYSLLFRKIAIADKSPHYEIRSNESGDIEAIELVTEDVNG